MSKLLQHIIAKNGNYFLSLLNQNQMRGPTRLKLFLNTFVANKSIIKSNKNQILGIFLILLSVESIMLNRH
ncbi:hypothetical protein BpHYR1_013151 [Brachionus plicatilis]|uniref:Uncharacterized protein n=1 Tax=Brachionus plicatilis TaxID=10195 RepID=A0A3M7RRD4_BRAPC|nr:hypothetical protein BpHYR1_013151 [Brachionus plicatilis]